MDAVTRFLSRLPDDIRDVGGSPLARIVVLIVALALNIGFYLPSIPDALSPGGIPGLDKVAHAAVFALTVWAAGRLLAPIGRFPIGWVVIIALAHAGISELVQSAMSARTAAGGDLIADVVGIALGLGLWIGERRYLERPDDAFIDEYDGADDRIPR